MDFLKELTPDTIRAFAALWKLITAVTALSALLIFRKPLGSLLQRLTNVTLKRGKTEIRVESSDSLPVPAGPQTAGATVEPEVLPPDDSRALPAVEDGGGPFFLMLDAFFDRNFEKATTEFHRLQSSEVDATKKLRNEAVYHYLRYSKINDSSALRELERLADIKEIRSYTLGWLALGHQHAGAYEKAKTTLRTAIDAADSDTDRARHVASLSSLLLEVGNPVEAIAVASQGLRSVLAPDSRSPLYRALAAAFKATQDRLSRAVALEKALELEPEDTKLRFETAYAQSEGDLSYVSVVNYNILLRQNPVDATALNNLGVAAGHLGLPIHSVRYYRASAKQNETLAMANLAYLLLDQGFVTEAKEILGDAQGQSEVHPNVGRATYDLSHRQEDESVKWNGALELGAKHKLFLQGFAEADFVPDSGSEYFRGEWLSSTGHRFRIEVKDNSIVGEGEFQSTKNRIEGAIHNRAARVRLKTWQPSLFVIEKGSYDVGNPGLAYVTASKNRLHIVITAKDSPEFLDLDRVSENFGSPT